MNRDNPIDQKRRFKNGVIAAVEIGAEKRAQASGFDPGACDSHGKRYVVDRTAAIVEAAADKLKAHDFGELESVCAAQVLALDVMFNEYAKEGSVNQYSNSSAMVALRAQQQCRATLKILLSLTAKKKSRNFDERTIENTNPLT